MLQLNHYSFRLPFEYPFTIAKGTKTHQESLVVTLGLRHWRGLGEAPAISYYNVSVASMIEELQAKRSPIERYALTDPKRFWHFLHHLFPENSFLVAALDIAGWDLFAQMRNMPLRHLLGIRSNDLPQSDYTIGIDDAEHMVLKMQSHPWPVYKIKMSSPDEMDRLLRLRSVTDAPFRIDANEGFTYDETRRLLPEWQKLGVRWLEQPLPKGAWEEMKALKVQSPIPLFADESCVKETDVALCAEAFHGVNIKLTKCGGITPALRMVQDARQRGLQIMLGSMCESAIGTAAMTHIAPLVDELDADGPLLLTEDVAEGLRFEEARPYTAPWPGLGLRFWAEAKPKSYF